MKKLLSFFLVGCIVIFNVDASASEKEINISLPKTEKAVEVLREMDILQGDTAGNLNPEKLLTRAEFATILTRVLFKGEYAENKFADTNGHWAANSISLMAEKNIVSGYDNGLFGPDDNVTLSQAVKILVNLLGYGKADFKYPDDYILQAAKLAITARVEKRAEEAITREDAANIILASLYLPCNNASGAMIEEVEKNIFFVSADGSENGDGSSENPWNSISKAAEAVSGSAIVFVDEGTYNEEHTITFKNGGESKNNPLILRARYGADVKVVSHTDTLIDIPENSNYITIENIFFSQSKEASAGDAPFVSVKGSGAVIKNNVFTAAQDVISVQGAKNVLIEGNTISGGKNALKIDGGSSIDVKSNIIEKQTHSAITAFGNVSGINISSNSLFLGSEAGEGGIILGDEATGITKCIAWNNVIYAQGAADTPGVLAENVTDLCFYNNIADGVRSAIDFADGNKNIMLRNNVFMNTAEDALSYKKSPSKFDSDYNCYYGAYPQIMEENSIFENPYFVSEGEDWRLMNGSALAGSGMAMTDGFLCTDGSVILLDNSDFNGHSRTDNWNMGIFAGLSGDEIVSGEEEETQEVMLSLDFRKGADHLVTSGGKWNVSNGAYFQDEDASTARATAVYDGGIEWANYEVSADVESSTAIDGNASGLIFRSDLEMRNMYAFRFLTGNSLEFVRWKDGSFLNIQRWNYAFNADTVYNLKVRAEGNSFTFYVNGEKIGEAEDDTFASGSVGFYCFREVNRYDNLKVVSVK